MESTDVRAAAAPAVSARILVVEDDPACLKTLSRALRGPDRVVVTAVSAQEALGCLASEAFDLVVLDFLLGKGMNGDEVLRRMRAQARTREIPVIVLSGEATGKDFEACFALGANECFMKPLSVVILRRKAEELLKARRAAVPPQARLQGGDVLLVDDDADHADLARLWLESSGYCFRCASTVAEFWRSVEHRLPECIVMDLGLGREDGLALCDAVKSHARAQVVPIVVFTARPDARAAAYAHKAVCVVEKGTGAEVELPRAVGAVIAQQRRALGILDFGEVRVHSPESAVYLRGEKVATLDHGPFSIFLRLVQRSPSAVPDEELRGVAAVRPAYHRRGGEESPPRTMPTYIYNLRLQLGRELGGRIRRLKGSGYAYVEP